MNLMSNLGLLDNFVKEILASDSSQFYLRKEQVKTRRLVTNDLNKSAAMVTIEQKDRKKALFSVIVFGKILLDKICYLLFENFNKRFCY